MIFPYKWITFSQAISALQNRLSNPTKSFWTDEECGVYLIESLRCWNALTETWNMDFIFPAENGWTNLGTLEGSPRLRTVTDADLYSDMQYMLLEPVTGAGTWTGTNQFTLAELQYTLQKRRDEMIQATGCNMGYLTVPTTPSIRRNPFPDTVLEPQRIRVMLAVADPPSGFVISPSETPLVGQLQPPVVDANYNVFTMTREDTQSFEYFQPGYLQTTGTPESWSVVSGPPLSFDVDNAPNVPAFYDVVALLSGPQFAPPEVTLLGVPDDWSWVAKWGALADLLSRENEATDRERAAYCLKRFTDGLKIMQSSNWLLQGGINGVVVDTPSMMEQDSYSPEWQSDPNIWPVIVQAGMDFISIGPMPDTNIPPASISVGVTLVGNQPIPSGPDDFVQISRDVFDVVLGYAQRLACFKMGGFDFAETKPLEDDFYRLAAATNKRLLTLGIFNDVIHTEGQRQEEDVPR